jgi:hypothetical protein
VPDNLAKENTIQIVKGNIDRFDTDRIRQLILDCDSIVLQRPNNRFDVTRRFVLGGVCLLLMLGAAGCVTISVIKPVDLPVYVGDDIVVTRTNGKVERFMGGDFSVDTLGVEIVLRGKGREYTDRNRTVSIAIADSILAHDMVSVEAHQKSIFYYTGSIIFISTVSIVALFLLLWLAHGGGSLGVGG